MKAIMALTAILIFGSTASANIFIQCGTGLDDENVTLEETVLTISYESWIEGTSGEDFKLEVNGTEVIGAKGEGTSAEGLKIVKKYGDSIGGMVGFVIEVDPWEDLTTRARKKTIGGFAGGVTQELDCLVTEM